MTPSPASRLASPLLPLILLALAGCVTVSKEQAETEQLMWDAARECKMRYSTIHSVDRIDLFGRLHFTFLGAGPENAAFLSCYQELANEKIRTAANLPAERLVLADPARRQITVRARASGNAVMVPVRLNTLTEETLFLVDTGASYTVLSPKIASRLELPITANTRRGGMVIAGGREITMPRVHLTRLTLGDATVENLYVGVYDILPGMPDVHGVLGLDFFRYFRVSIDQRREQLVLDVDE